MVCDRRGREGWSLGGRKVAELQLSRKVQRQDRFQLVSHSQVPGLSFITYKSSWCKLSSLSGTISEISTCDTIVLRWTISCDGRFGPPGRCADVARRDCETSWLLQNMNMIAGELSSKVSFCPKRYNANVHFSGIFFLTRVLLALLIETLRHDPTRLCITVKVQNKTQFLRVR